MEWNERYYLFNLDVSYVVYREQFIVKFINKNFGKKNIQKWFLYIFFMVKYFLLNKNNYST